MLFLISVRKISTYQLVEPKPSHLSTEKFVVISAGVFCVHTHTQRVTVLIFIIIFCLASIF